MKQSTPATWKVFLQKSQYCPQGFCRPIAKGGVTAVWQNDLFSFARQSFIDALKLAKGSVIVIHSLDQQYWNLNLQQIFFQIPIDKLRIQPGLIPAPKSAVNIITMISGQFPAQVSGFKVGFGLPNTAQGEFLDEDMWSHQDQTPQALSGDTAGVDQGDGGAVAVADQDSLADIGGSQDFRQHLLCFVMHETQGAGKGAGV